jgi:hypothetical protein
MQSFHPMEKTMIAQPYLPSSELDAVLKRDLTVLSTLAHVTWLTTEQLHRLCFPGYTLATVRTSLRYFEAAGWVRHARWRIRGCPGSQLWAITSKGRAMVERYLPITAPPSLLDLARPTTALEQDEYRVQLAVRSFVVELILEARRTACLAHLTLALPNGSHVGLGGVYRGCSPDAILSIIWHPQIMQPPNWVPWLSQPGCGGQAIEYQMYVDRALSMHSLAQILPAEHKQAVVEQSLPIMIFEHEQRLAAAQRALRVRPQPHTVRVSTWQRLKSTISGNTWLDEHGRTCSLRPIGTGEQ